MPLLAILQGLADAENVLRGTFFCPTRKRDCMIYGVFSALNYMIKHTAPESTKLYHSLMKIL